MQRRSLQLPAHNQASPSQLGSPQQQMALHSSLAGTAQQVLSQASRHAQGFAQVPLLNPVLNPHISTASMPVPSVAGRQQARDSYNRFPFDPSCTPSGQHPSNQQGVAAPQSGPPLQLPAHVQQWLTALAQDTQQALSNSNEPDLTCRETDAAAHVSRPRHAVASAEFQEDLRHMRAELADVKARFADTQVCAASHSPPLLIAGFQYTSKAGLLGAHFTKTLLHFNSLMLCLLYLLGVHCDIM